MGSHGAQFSLSAVALSCRVSSRRAWALWRARLDSLRSSRRVFEQDGAAAFVKSWDDLLACIVEKSDTRVKVGVASSRLADAAPAVPTRRRRNPIL